MNLQRIMLEDNPCVTPGFKSPGCYIYHDWLQKETRIYTLGILRIFPLFLEMYEDSYTRNPNIWEQDNKKSDYTKDNNIRPFHGE